MDSDYDDQIKVKSQIIRGKHRNLVGGLWDEIGQLQLEYMISQGLMPHHSLLDIGCGAFRGGVKFIPYLDPGKYWGVDKNQELLTAGWDLELKRYGLTSRQPREQLVCLRDFEFFSLGIKFDYAIAQSVFTHMSLNRIRRCLTRLAPCLPRNGRLYASFFEIKDHQDREQDQIHLPGGMTSHSDRSFYHYNMKDFEFIISGLPLRLEYFGNWEHPRSQNMLIFIRE